MFFSISAPGIHVFVCSKITRVGQQVHVSLFSALMDNCPDLFLFGTETASKLDLPFWSPEIGPDRERIDDTVSRSRVNKRPIRHDVWIGTIWKRSRVNIALNAAVCFRSPSFSL